MTFLPENWTQKVFIINLNNLFRSFLKNSSPKKNSDLNFAKLSTLIFIIKNNWQQKSVLNYLNTHVLEFLQKFAYYGKPTFK